MGGARMNGLDRQPHRLILAFTLEEPFNRATYLMSLDRFAPIVKFLFLANPNSALAWRGRCGVEPAEILLQNYRLCRRVMPM